MLGFARDLARQAGERLMGAYGRLASGQIDHKGRRDLVTAADRETEAFLAAEIERAFPDDAILGEESIRRPGRSGHVWILDPVDGTTNFVHQHPFFCISLARASGYSGPPNGPDGLAPHETGYFRSGELPQVDLGVIYAPVLGELFTAERGRGAELNERPIRVSETGDLGQSLMATGFAYRRNELAVNNLENFARLALEVRGIRRCGAAALDLCYVAAGRFEAFWELYLKPWDVAAGMLVVEEAGGRVTGIAPDRHPLEGVEVVASNGRVHEEVRRQLVGPDPAWVASEREVLFGRR